MTALVGAPEAFDPSTDDWRLYAQRFEHFLLANGVTDDSKRLHLLLALIGNSTFKLLANLVAPQTPGELAYKQVCERLEKHFSPKPVKIAERFRFHNCRQQSGETMAEYLAELRKLAIHCEFGDFLEDALCDRFVCGLKDEAMQRRLLGETDLSLKKAFEITQAMEAAAINAREIQTTGQQKPCDVNAVTPKFNRQAKQPTKTNMKCTRCLGTGHDSTMCRFRSAKCNNCKKTGHIARACRSEKRDTTARGSQPQSGQPPQQKSSSGMHQVTPSEVAAIVHIHTVSQRKSLPKSYKANISVNGTTLEMEIDTGAAVSVVSETTWEQKLNKPNLRPCTLVLKGYPDNPLEIMGCCDVKVQDGETIKQLELIICKGNGLSLLGRNWLEEIKLNWPEIAYAHGVKTNQSKLDKILDKYKKVFTAELGHCKGVKAKLYVKENSIPKFHRPRPVPLAMKAKIETELQRQVDMGILEKVDTADWAAPIVPVTKPSGEIRLCGDYKVSINPQLEINQYPLPHPEILFAALNGGTQFTKLDLSEAYLQIPLDEQAKKYLVINTHKGLYRFTRLPYGVASAPSIFQQIMDQILPKLPGVVCYLDDILVTGKDEKEHLNNLEAVLQKLQEHNLRIKSSKCKFMQKSVEYLGKVVSAEGIQTSKRKVEAIQKLTPPTNQRSLRSLLGIVNHYGKFIPFLADLSAPLNKLLRKDSEFSWSAECDKSLNKIKEALMSAKVLAHFDPKVPLGLACDASKVGIGAVLYHRYDNGTERPIAYASKALTKAEQNYSQIEREALSLVYGVKKFHQFLFGYKFTLLTDHKPLLTILGPKSGIPEMAASRLQRWAIILSAYTYEIQYKATKEHGNADTLSRFPLKQDEQFENEQSLEPVVNLIQTNQLEKLPVSSKDIEAATKEDDTLSKVCEYIKNGWPAHKRNVSKAVQPYFPNRFQLTIHSGCILKGLQVVIPTKLQDAVMAELHDTHAGMVKTKSVARMHIWWPGISKEIEQCIRQCEKCQVFKNDPARAPLHPWETPNEAWERVHIDFAGPFKGKMWLIIVDAFSKWPEVIQMTTTTAEKTVEVLRALFSRFGLPKAIVTDNGPQFTSATFESFCKNNGITHKRSAPYHPSTNGEAERFVQSFKTGMKTGTGDLQTILCKFLIRYRSSPHVSTDKTPAELMFNRNIRTRLDLLHPLPDKTTDKGDNSSTKTRQLKVGDFVWARSYHTDKKWIPGIITQKYGPRNYRVRIGEQTQKRHIDQLRKRQAGPETKEGKITLNDFDLFPSPSTTTPSTTSTTDEGTVTSRYPQRNRHPPERLTY